jgi:hypothetical protein
MPSGPPGNSPTRPPISQLSTWSLANRRSRKPALARRRQRPRGRRLHERRHRCGRAEEQTSPPSRPYRVDLHRPRSRFARKAGPRLCRSPGTGQHRRPCHANTEAATRAQPLAFSAERPPYDRQSRGSPPPPTRRHCGPRACGTCCMTRSRAGLPRTTFIGAWRVAASLLVVFPARAERRGRAAPCYAAAGQR